MKKIIFFIALVASVNNSYAQKTRSNEIVKVSMGGLSVYQTIYYNAENSPLDTSYSLLGRDGRYQQLIEYITAYRGDITDLYKFLKYSIDFYDKEQDGTTENKNGHTLSISKLMGQKFLYFYEEKGNGYIGFNRTMLNKLISKIEQWATENKVELK